MINHKLNLGIIFLIYLVYKPIFGRSIHRTMDPNLPSITVHDGDPNNLKYTLTDSHIKRFPLFEAYNEPYLNQKKLPSKLISFRNQPKKTVYGKQLNDQLESLIAEIWEGKTNFTNFKILKNKDFNFKTRCGLIVLKFKDFPFVAKVFIETPRSLSRPYSKGLFPMGMFIMGGSNRHLNGFTRIKNMENIKAKVENHPIWKDKLSVPRKWFWVPKDTKWLYIDARNLGGYKTESTRFPAIYAVIADEIFSVPSTTGKNGVRNLAICRDLDFAIDPHYNNFVTEKGTNKLVMYDTEHFPTLIGSYFYKLRPARRYVGWYTHLARNFIKQRLFSAKSCQKKRQQPGSIYPLY